jgi:hypothetical protein
MSEQAERTEGKRVGGKKKMDSEIRDAESRPSGGPSVVVVGAAAAVACDELLNKANVGGGYANPGVSFVQSVRPARLSLFEVVAVAVAVAAALGGR